LSPLQQVLDALGDGARRCGTGWEARCPSHDDRVASLSINEGADGRVLLFCHAGCESHRIVGDLGLTWAGLFPESRDKPLMLDDAVIVYDYHDEQGRVLFKVGRFSAPKSFRPFHPDGMRWKIGQGNVRRVPYRLPEVISAVRENRYVFVVEGEKDADNLAKLGFVATTNPGGAGKWQSEWGCYFADANVAILSDNDPPGRDHALGVARSIHGVARSVRIVELPGLPTKGDISDWISGGGTKEALEAIVMEAHEWDPSSEDDPKLLNPPQGAPSAHRDHLRRRIVVRSADEIEPEGVEWLWEGRLALGSLNLVVGLPGQNKSTLMLELAARASRGQLVGDLYGLPVDTIIASAEDSPAHTMVPRLMAAGADLARTHFATVLLDDEIESHAVLPLDVEALRQEVIRRGARLLVIDPLTAHLDARIDSHRDQDIRRSLAPLTKLAEDTGCAVVPIVHLNKTRSTDFFEKTGGSIGITAAARSALLAARDPEEGENGPGRVIVHAKCNLGPAAPTLRFLVETREIKTNEGVAISAPAIVWRGEAAHIGAQQALASHDDEERSAMDEAKDFLRDLLRSGAVNAATAKNLAKEAGVAAITLRRARRELGVTTRKVGAPGEEGQKWLWELPHEEARPDTEGDQRSAKVINLSSSGSNDHIRGQEAGLRPSIPQAAWRYGGADGSCIVCGARCITLDAAGRVRHPACQFGTVAG
jgi:putative DNA primase/helicase